MQGVAPPTPDSRTTHKHDRLRRSEQNILLGQRAISDSGDRTTRIAVQGHVFIKRKPSINFPFKRFWCELRGSSLFIYSSQGDRHPKAAYGMQSANISMLGAVEDRFRLQLVTVDKETDHQRGVQFNLAPELARVTTAFDTQTENEMRDWCLDRLNYHPTFLWVETPF